MRHEEWDLPCPFCRVGADEPCVTTSTGKLASQTHANRGDLGGTSQDRFALGSERHDAVPPVAYDSDTTVRRPQSSDHSGWGVAALFLWPAPFIALALLVTAFTGADSTNPSRLADSRCHPSYRPCVPSRTGDVDCGDLGFSVRVVGVDVYRLDRDRDGIGCESNR